MSNPDEGANLFRVRRRPLIVELRGQARQWDTGSMVEGRMAKKTIIVGDSGKVVKPYPARLLWRVPLALGADPRWVRAKMVEIADLLLEIDVSIGGGDFCSTLSEWPSLGEPAIEFSLHPPVGVDVEIRLQTLAPLLSRMAATAFGPNTSRVRVVSADDPQVTILDIAA